MDLLNQEVIDAFYRVCNEDDYSSRLQILHPATSNSTDREEEEEELENNTSTSVDYENNIYFRRENRALERLEEQGVPPLYPRHQMHRVRRDPARFEALLRPFNFHPPISFNISGYYSNYDGHRALNSEDGAFLQRQELRWRQFRRGQAYNRRLDTTTQGEAVANDAEDEGDLRRRHTNDLVPGSEPGGDMELYSDLQSRRDHERRFLREQPPCRNLSEYKLAVKERLLRQGFRVPFAPEDAFLTQDRLTSWIEYMGVEYWWLDQYKKKAESPRQDTEDLYQELRRSIALQPHESIEWLRSRDATLMRRIERDQAYMALNRAVLRVQRLRDSALAARNQAAVPRGHASALATAEADVMLAEESKRVAIKRYELIEQFVNRSSGYYASQKVVERHARLIDWVRGKYAEIERQVFPEAAAAERARMSQTTVAFVLPEEEPVMLEQDVDAEIQPGWDTTSSGSSASTTIIPAAAQRRRSPGEGVVFRFGDAATTIATTTADGPTTTEAVQERHRDVERTLQGSYERPLTSSSSSPISDATTAVASPCPLAPPPSSQPPPSTQRSIRFAVARGLAAAREAAAHAAREFDRQAHPDNLVSSTIPRAPTAHRRLRPREMSNGILNEAEVALSSSSESESEPSRPVKRPRLILRPRPQRD